MLIDRITEAWCENFNLLDLIYSCFYLEAIDSQGDVGSIIPSKISAKYGAKARTMVRKRCGRRQGFHVQTACFDCFGAVFEPNCVTLYHPESSLVVHLYVEPESKEGKYVTEEYICLALMPWK